MPPTTRHDLPSDKGVRKFIFHCDLGSGAVYGRLSWWLPWNVSLALAGYVTARLTGEMRNIIDTQYVRMCSVFQTDTKMEEWTS